MRKTLLALLATTSLSSPCLAAAEAEKAEQPRADRELCLRHIGDMEASYGIPQGLLAAIGLTESGRVVSRKLTVWPWTVNAEGAGHYFETKEDAIAFVEALQADGVRSIDVGCMQINLKYHPDAFASLEDAFDPAVNTEYGAQLLTALKGELTTWLKAVRRYHSAAPERGVPYGERVMANWDVAKAGDLKVAEAGEATEATEAAPAKKGQDVRKVVIAANAIPVLVKFYTPLAVQISNSTRPPTAFGAAPSAVFAPKVVTGMTGLGLQDYR
jgi:hypothetical protein